MGSSGEGLSAARLAEIRQTLDILLAEPRSSTEFLAAELLAEVERLRAREVARVVADGKTIYYASFEGTFCTLCNAYVPGNLCVPEYDIAQYPHKADCPVEQARALLASTEQEA